MLVTNLRYRQRVNSSCPQKEQVITMNHHISSFAYFESRLLTSRPHLRKVSDESCGTYFYKFNVFY